jgi:hypothetical protein
MENKTTPVPWKVAEYNGLFKLEIGEDGLNVFNEGDCDEAEANAKLAASSPILQQIVEKQDELIRLHELENWTHEDVEQMDKLSLEIESLKQSINL